VRKEEHDSLHGCLGGVCRDEETQSPPTPAQKVSQRYLGGWEFGGCSGGRSIPVSRSAGSSLGLMLLPKTEARRLAWNKLGRLNECFWGNEEGGP
jgi:hypothetical protein